MNNKAIFFLSIFCTCTMSTIKPMEPDIDLKLLATINTLLKHSEFDRAHAMIYKWKISKSVDEEAWQQLEKLILKKEYPDDKFSFDMDPMDTTDMQFPFDTSTVVDGTAASSTQQTSAQLMPALRLESLPTEADLSDELDELEERTVHQTTVIPLAIQKKAYEFLLDDQLEEAQLFLALNDIDEKTIAQFIADSKK